ncbi:SulP family inorganic anion transporter [Campylobacter sp. RM12654]|uniref:SulP family inorganic anion transporter n=1 Tax=unclassified Campylobacter TaxID=2593542 RepID=UPI001D4F8774|nr:SulP family inorganic anion transporter [Campylobacter sp. RM12651]MBZ7976337.1 SulP family inorganic anion transporter [Campylobacter sp. RM12637]MBZ7978674.1 SulP family inorganic anion transporter [Campylobacter sp. RM12654]MBZ7993877.1 SulP family inorganic anion transporter [Campylobacter sp. RM9333]ULO02728.1 sulfate permease [Campylobacter sp. RM12651]
MQKKYLFNLNNITKEALAGLVVGFAIIPEAIAFSLIAGVNPKVGIYASICILLVTAFAGGRPALISAATGAMALLMIDLVKGYGLEYLMVAGILAGIFQILFGVLKIARFMSFIPRSVMVGFVNALAILIFMAQLDEIFKSNLLGLVIMCVALGIIYLFPLLPKIGKIIPSSLVAIIILTIISINAGFDVRMIKDLGELPSELPHFLIPNVPLNIQTLQIILPYSLSLAVVGIMESLMTSNVLDELTATKSNKNRECIGQGLANISTGFFGGMAGCGMIGQSMINVKSGARTRLSTFLAGVYLCLIILFCADFVNYIPMGVLVGIMIMVSISTFDFISIRQLKSFPFSANAVMIATVIATILTHNLAIGVLIGVLLEALFFANKVSYFLNCKKTLNGDIRVYKFYGQIFFRSADKFYSEFDFNENCKNVLIDVSNAHFWDISAIYMLDKIKDRFQEKGALVTLKGVNFASSYMIKKFSVKDNID